MELISRTIVVVLLAIGGASIAACSAPPSPPAEAHTASAPVQERPASWRINDGAQLSDDERRVFANLWKACSAEPPATPRYQNYVSKFEVRKTNDHEWTFSGVRLIRQSLYVPNAPTLMYLVEGTFNPQTNEITAHETKMESAGLQ